MGARVDDEPQLITRRDAAAICGVSLAHFDRHVSKELPRVVIGRRVLFDRRDLVAWITSRKRGGTTETTHEDERPTANVVRSSARGAAILRRLQRRLRGED